MSDQGNRVSRRSLLAGAAAIAAGAHSAGAGTAKKKTKGKQVWVFFGTYTQRGSKGIYRSRMDLSTGALTPAELAIEAEQPSFLVIHPSHKYLYAVNELESFNGEKAGAVSAFALDTKTGSLKFLNQQSSRGGAPCHLVVDRAGKNVLAANYSGGSSIVFPIQADGTLGEPTGFQQHSGSSVNPQRQEAPHGHSINLSPDNRFAFTADLGLDKILIWKYDSAAGTIEPNEPPFAILPPGSGPRHFAFHPSGRFAFTNGEMTSTVTSMEYNKETGALKPLQTVSTLPASVEGKGNSTAEIVAHPSGKTVYCSNRGHDSIAVFGVDANTGALKQKAVTLTGGKTPRNFVVEQSGKYLLAENQDSDDVMVFRIDPKTGLLARTQHKLNVIMPVCARLVAVGK
jgi:6-phosphogluconolactonase